MSDRNRFPHIFDEVLTNNSLERTRALNMARGGHRPEIDLQDVIGGKFSAGEGVLAIHPELDDAAIATDIRCALEAAKGQPFKVIQAPSSIKDRWESENHDN